MDYLEILGTDDEIVTAVNRAVSLLKSEQSTGGPLS